MIQTVRDSELGAALWQYCFARILAQRFGSELQSLPFFGFPNSSRVIRGEQILAPVIRWDGQWPRDAATGRKIESGELFCPPQARLLLRGGFQRFELIADFREDIREDWLSIREPLMRRDAGDFAICVRISTEGGEERTPVVQSAFTEKEIRRLVASVPHERLYLITNVPEHPKLRAVRDLGGIVAMTDEFQELRFIRSFQKVALSQSATHWWGAFLGEAREIYFPKCARGIWSRAKPANLAHEPWWHGIDVRVPDEPRYIYDW